MSQLIVKDLDVQLDSQAKTAVVGGINDAGIGIGSSGSTGADQGVGIGANGGNTLLFASPVISTQLVFDIDNQILIAPITELNTSLTNLTAVGSILNGLNLGL